jgi:hypothetical protein
VLVTIHDHEGFVCEVVGTDAQQAVIAALDAAIASDGEDPDGFDQIN